MDKFLIAGLGNVGPEYAGTRHNIGFDVVDLFVEKHAGSFNMQRLAAVAEVKLKGKKLICIKPSTFMNLSGKAVKYWLENENVSVENLLVIADDLAIPLDKLRLRPAGSSGGHNGFTSIQESIQTVNYAKLRFGIGNDYSKGRQVEYVLGKWTELEIPVVKAKLAKCVELIEDYALSGILQAMNRYNNLIFKL
ncbi:MAG: aminoacyl-tRNA hydrolase [Chitinophagaceae bacterium]